MRRPLHVLGLFAMILSLALGALTTPASAQGDPCAAALAAATGGATTWDGYEIVWGSGGSGSQVVLGTDGDDWLSGGSGDDILCGFGGDDVLEGGSGADWLDAGSGSNELHGGSGNDTLIGVEGDVFRGGSGANEIVARPPDIAPPPAPSISVSFSQMPPTASCWVNVTLTDFAPGTYTIAYHGSYVLFGTPGTSDNSISGIVVGSEPVTVAGSDYNLSLPSRGGVYSTSTVQVTVDGVSTDAIPVSCS